MLFLNNEKYVQYWRSPFPIESCGGATPCKICWVCKNFGVLMTELNHARASGLQNERELFFRHYCLFLSVIIKMPVNGTILASPLAPVSWYGLIFLFFSSEKIPLSNICGIIIITIILCVFTYLNPGRGGEHIKRLRTVVFSYVFCYEQSCSILSRDKKNLIQMLTWEKISYTNPPFHISIWRRIWPFAVCLESNHHKRVNIC